MKPEPIDRDRAAFICSLVRAGVPLERETVEQLVNHAVRTFTFCIVCNNTGTELREPQPCRTCLCWIDEAEMVEPEATFIGPDGSFPI